MHKALEITLYRKLHCSNTELKMSLFSRTPPPVPVTLRVFVRRISGSSEVLARTDMWKSNTRWKATNQQHFEENPKPPTYEAPQTKTRGKQTIRRKGMCKGGPTQSTARTPRAEDEKKARNTQKQSVWRRGRKERKVGWEVILCPYECRSYEHVREDGALSLRDGVITHGQRGK